jgi:hypothetical protein
MASYKWRLSPSQRKAEDARAEKPVVEERKVVRSGTPVSVVVAKPAWFPLLDEDAAPGDTPRFIWLGVSLELSDGTCLHWNAKHLTISTRLPDSDTYYKSGRVSGSKDGEHCVQSMADFRATHGLLYQVMVMEAINNVLFEMGR